MLNLLPVYLSTFSELRFFEVYSKSVWSEVTKALYVCMYVSIYLQTHHLAPPPSITPSITHPQTPAESSKHCQTKKNTPKTQDLVLALALRPLPLPSPLSLPLPLPCRPCLESARAVRGTEKVDPIPIYVPHIIYARGDDDAAR